MDVEKYPAGLRVLAVDDDRSGLLLLKKQLNLCNYNNVTTVTDATTAWGMLRERKGRDDQFDLVISDIFMVDGGIDGLKLLEHISLEMDISVILISANDDMETMIKGIKNGACDCLVKPVRLEQLRNIWMHVARKNMNNSRNKVIDDEDGVGQKLQPMDGDNIEKDGAKHTNKYSKKNKKDGNHAEDNKDRTLTQKKQRVQWSCQLHNKFLEAINKIGMEKAVPKKILEVMNVDGLSRECIASHLQKYRIYLKKLNDGMSQPEGSQHPKDLGRHEPSPTFLCASSSSNPFERMSSPSVFGMHNALPTESAQHIRSQRNLGIILQHDTQPSAHGVNLPNNVVFGNSYATSSRLAAVSGQVPTFWNEYQNQMAGLMGTTTQMVGFSEQAIVNFGSSSSSTVMPICNSSSIRPTLSNLLIGNSVMPNHMPNGGGATGILPEDGTVGHQFTSVGDQVNNNNEIPARTSETHDGVINGLDGFFADWMFL